jgi:uncharacterized protein
MDSRVNRMFSNMAVTIGLLCVVATVLIFLFGLLFHGCDVRYRSQKAACRAGDVQQCLAVAKIYEEKDSVFSDVLHYGDTIRESYRRACDLHSPEGCAGWVKGSIDDDEAAKRVLAYQIACDGGIATSCFELGDLYARGKDVPHDDARGLALYLKSCTAKVGEGCEDAAILRALGRGGSPADDAAALELDKQGCAAGDKDACAEVNWYPSHHKFRWQK